MTFADFTEIGFFPLQDHADDGTPVSARLMLAGGRVTSAKKGANVTGTDSLVQYGKENGLGTLGDVHPWLFWQTRSREARGMGAWAQAFGAVAIDADGYYGSVSPQPLRSDHYENDTRFHPLSTGGPVGLPRIPRGALLTVVPGTEEAEQHPLVLWSDPRLIAPNARGPGECGTLVVDLQPTHEICMDGDKPGVDGRAARLQSLVRVIAVAPGQTFAGLDGGEGNTLALNFTRSGVDGIPGYGAFFAEIDSRSGSGPITPGGSRPTTPGGSGSNGPITHGLSAGPGSYGGGVTDAGSSGGGESRRPQDFGSFEPTRLGHHGIGLMAHLGAYGPLHAGAQSDKHHHGSDRDGHPVNAAHISVDAFFYRDADKDAPIAFEGDYPNPSPLPIPAPAHISYDGVSQHAFAGTMRPGYWRLWCETPDVTPTQPPGVPVVSRPPVTGGPVPAGPTTPGPGRPTTPGPGNPTAPGPQTPGGGGRPTGGPWPWGPPGPSGPNPNWHPPTKPITPNPGGKRFPGYPATDPPPSTGGGGPLTGGNPPGSGGGPHPSGPTTGAGGQPGTPCKTQPNGGVGSTPARGGQPGRTGGGDVPPPGGAGAGRTPARGRAGGAVGTYPGGGGNPRATLVPSGAALFGVGGGEIVPRGAMPGRGVAGTRQVDPRLDLGRWSGRSQVTREPQEIPGVAERIGRTSERRSLYTIFRPMAQGFAALNFRPQLTALGYPNFEHNPQFPAPMFFNDEAVRPQVLALHAWGGQSAAETEWAYIERPEDSRARGGTAAGGVMFHPPGLELEDYYGVGSAVNVETPATTSYVLAAPGVAFALGLPTASGALAANAVTIAQGTATARPLEIEHNGTAIFRGYDDGTDVIVELARGGTAAIVVPSGTTAQRPATPVAGMMRYNSTAGALEYRGASAWRSLDLGDIATLDALGAGAAAGTMAYFDGSTWQLLAPPASSGYVITCTSGTLSWVDPNTLITP